jgi:hypothetical protein
MKNRMGRFADRCKDFEGWLFKPASIYPLVALRLAFGLAMAMWAVYMMISGTVAEVFSMQVVHFPYRGLEWIKPLPFWGMTIIFVVLAVSAIGMGAGWHFRKSGLVFTLSFAYVSLIDKASYLSYYYYVLIIALMLLVSPAYRLFSIDLIRKPQIRIDFAPVWLLWAFKVQVVMVFFFAGMAKLNSDWLYTGVPVMLWLQDTLQNLGISSSFLAANTWIVLALSWFLVVFDFVIPHFLLDSRTSVQAFILVVIVQLTGVFFLPTGFFPVLVILSCTVFLPSRIIHHFISRVSYFLYDVFQFKGDVFTAGGTFILQYRMRRLFPLLSSLFLAFQFVLPVYFYLSWGSLRWANTAFHFSWDIHINHQKNSVAFYKVNKAKGESEPIAIDHMLSPVQKSTMASDPSMLKQFIGNLKETNPAFSAPEVEIQAQSCISLNGRPADCFTLSEPSEPIAAETGYE